MAEEETELLSNTTVLNQANKFGSIEVIAAWSLAIFLGVAIWAMLLTRVVPAIVRNIH
jgi:hypothetical protein